MYMYTDLYWLCKKWHTIIVFEYLNLMFMMKITVPTCYCINKKWRKLRQNIVSYHC